MGQVWGQGRDQAASGRGIVGSGCLSKVGDAHRCFRCPGRSGGQEKAAPGWHGHWGPLDQGHTSIPQVLSKCLQTK